MSTLPATIVVSEKYRNYQPGRTFKGVDGMTYTYGIDAFASEDEVEAAGLKNVAAAAWIKGNQYAYYTIDNNGNRTDRGNGAVQQDWREGLHIIDADTDIYAMADIKMSGSSTLLVDGRTQYGIFYPQYIRGGGKNSVVFNGAEGVVTSFAGSILAMGTITVAAGELEFTGSIKANSLVVAAGATLDWTANLDGKLKLSGEGTIAVQADATFTNHALFAGDYTAAAGVTVLFSGRTAAAITISGAGTFDFSKASIAAKPGLTLYGGSDATNVAVDNKKLTIGAGTYGTVSVNGNTLAVGRRADAALYDGSGHKKSVLDLTGYFNGYGSDSFDSGVANFNQILFNTVNAIVATGNLSAANYYFTIDSAAGGEPALSIAASGSVDWVAGSLTVSLADAALLSGPYTIIAGDGDKLAELNGIQFVYNRKTVAWAVGETLDDASDLRFAFTLTVSNDELILNRFQRSSAVIYISSSFGAKYAYKNDSLKEQRIVGVDAANSLDTAAQYAVANDEGMARFIVDNNSAYKAAGGLMSAANGVTLLYLTSRTGKNRLDGDIFGRATGLAGDTTFEISNFGAHGNLFGGAAAATADGTAKLVIRNYNDVANNIMSGSLFGGDRISANGGNGVDSELNLFGGQFSGPYVAGGGYAVRGGKERGGDAVLLIRNEASGVAPLRIASTIVGGSVADGKASAGSRGNTSVTIDLTGDAFNPPGGGIVITGDIYGGGAGVNGGEAYVRGDSTVTFIGDGAKLQFTGTVSGGVLGAGEVYGERLLVFRDFTGSFLGQIRDFDLLTVTGESSVAIGAVQNTPGTNLFFDLTGTSADNMAAMLIVSGSSWGFGTTISVDAADAEDGEYLLASGWDFSSGFTFKVGSTGVAATLGQMVSDGTGSYLLSYDDSARTLTLTYMLSILVVEDGVLKVAGDHTAQQLTDAFTTEANSISFLGASTITGALSFSRAPLVLGTVAGANVELDTLSNTGGNIEINNAGSLEISGISANGRIVTISNSGHLDTGTVGAATINITANTGDTLTGVFNAATAITASNSGLLREVTFNAASVSISASGDGVAEELEVTGGGTRYTLSLDLDGREATDAVFSFTDDSIALQLVAITVTVDAEDAAGSWLLADNAQWGDSTVFTVNGNEIAVNGTFHTNEVLYTLTGDDTTGCLTLRADWIGDLPTPGKDNVTVDSAWSSYADGYAFIEDGVFYVMGTNAFATLAAAAANINADGTAELTAVGDTEEVTVGVSQSWSGTLAGGFAVNVGDDATLTLGEELTLSDFTGNFNAVGDDQSAELVLQTGSLAAAVADFATVTIEADLAATGLWSGLEALNLADGVELTLTVNNQALSLGDLGLGDGSVLSFVHTGGTGSVTVGDVAGEGRIELADGMTLTIAGTLSGDEEIVFGEESKLVYNGVTYRAVEFGEDGGLSVAPALVSITGGVYAADDTVAYAMLVGTAADVALDSLTVTGNSNANTSLYGYRGALVRVEGELTVGDLQFKDNELTYANSGAGAAAAWIAGLFNMVNGGELTVAGGEVSGNTATTATSLLQGGVFRLDNGSTATFSDVVFSGNTAGSTAGGLWAMGGVFFVYESAVIFNDVVFTDNAITSEVAINLQTGAVTGGAAGAAVYLYEDARATFNFTKDTACTGNYAEWIDQDGVVDSMKVGYLGFLGVGNNSSATFAVAAGTTFTVGDGTAGYDGIYLYEAATLFKTGDGAMVVNSDLAFGGGANPAGGTIAVTGGTLTLAGGVEIAGSVTITGSVEITGEITYSGNARLNWNGDIFANYETFTGANLTVVAAGETLNGDLTTYIGIRQNPASTFISIRQGMETAVFTGDLTLIILDGAELRSNDNDILIGGIYNAKEGGLVDGSTSLVIGTTGGTGPAVGTNAYRGNILGGGGRITGSSSVTINSGTVYAKSIIGGTSWNGTAADSSVTIHGGTIYTLGNASNIDTNAKRAIYGGSYGVTQTLGSGTVTITGGTFEVLIYGGNQAATISSTAIDISGGSFTNSVIHAAGCDAGGTVTGDAVVTITGGSFTDTVTLDGQSDKVGGTSTLTLGVLFAGKVQNFDTVNAELHVTIGTVADLGEFRLTGFEQLLGTFGVTALFSADELTGIDFFLDDEAATVGSAFQLAGADTVDDFSDDLWACLSFEGNSLVVTWGNTEAAATGALSYYQSNSSGLNFGDSFVGLDTAAGVYDQLNADDFADRLKNGFLA